MAVVDRLRRVPLVDSPQHGKYSLRDVDLATGQVAVSKDDVKPDEAAVNAAFAEMPLEQLTALHQNAADSMAALQNIDAKMRAEGGSDAAPNFDPLTAQLAKMSRWLRAQLALRAGANGQLGEGSVEISKGDAPVGVIKSRQDAIRALDAVADFFRRNEPSSPIPLLVERAKRLVSKDFLEVLEDIAPEALGTARAAGGLKEDVR
jgi:type VI secretion system protein ImpA